MAECQDPEHHYIPYHTETLWQGRQLLNLPPADTIEHIIQFNTRNDEHACM